MHESGNWPIFAFPSIWGHLTGRPGNVEGTNWLDKKLKEVFAEALKKVA